GLPAHVSILKLCLIARLPPLECLLDYKSLLYSIRLLFQDASHPLRPTVLPPNRTISIGWLNTITSKTTRPLPTVWKTLSQMHNLTSPGDRLEDNHTPGPSTTIHPILTMKADRDDYLSDLDPLIASLSSLPNT